ncbi:serine hydrolase domain-containing protein [Tunicatimonas pelagia]|uniref:serine hydrolase domain-containing protein n=1 Tax=Tunicatimonas pelagia TaxID=931531 RepID=UPI0026652D5D|nr:serine hydrolase [Tunicatimonas pelagia]WKN46337.1 serine hydrolase [Tunicatimonas pelagia]
MQKRPHKRLLVKVFLLIVISGFTYLVYYIFQALPILTGFGAKHLCSCHFVAQRSDSSVLVNELARFPYRLAEYEVNDVDSSATASIFGTATRQAVYRPGAGCVLRVNDKSVAPIPQLAQITEQKINNYPIPEEKAVRRNVNYSQLSEAVGWAFSEPDAERLKNTKAVVVVYDDTLVAERYAPGFSAQTLMPGWSMTKSVINALVGITVQQSQLDINQPAPVPAWQEEDDPRKNITWDHLLRMNSGLKWDETYFGASDVTQMLYLSEDMASIAMHRPPKEEPGEEWYYSSGTTNILSFLLRQRYGDDAYYALPYQQLFQPLGMSSAVIEADLSGTFVGSSYMLATTRDWAKFGLLYYHDGIWRGQRILPEGWVKYTTRPVEDAPFRKYGAQFWLNAGERNRPDQREFPDVPTELFFAQGFDEQSIFILPKHKLVIVRLGITARGNFDKNYFLSELIKAFE